MKKPTHTDAESILRGLGLFDDGHLINAAVAIAMYDDHLEIINPGILHFNMTFA